MSKFYSISIVDKYAFILYLENRNKNLIVLENETIEISKLSSYIKNKKNLHISILQRFEFSQNIKVPVAIANGRNIKNYLLYKIKESNPNIDILFNFYKLPKQNDEENIIYNVEALDEKSYLNDLAFVDKLDKVKSSTTLKFALLGLANKCIVEDYYICIHVTASTIIFLAVEQKKLIFSRTTVLNLSSKETMLMEIAENITQTISYIKSQFREIEFKNLSLSGSVAFNDAISQQIAMFNNFNISVLYPNTFIKNMNTSEPQEYILSIGNAFVAKTDQFVPKVILSIRQFNILSVIELILSFLILLYISCFTFEEYEKYNDLSNQNKILKSKYLKEISQTKMLSQKELKKYIDHIFMVKKYLNNAPVDILSILKPLVELDKPSYFEYNNEHEDISFKVEFEKHFKTLIDLYEYKKEFDKRFNEINSTMQINKKASTNYKELIHKVTISSSGKKTKAHKIRSRRQ